MNMRKKGPYILLFILICAVIFILGFQYGKSVEKTNKAIEQILKASPTRKPTEPVSVSYNSYENTDCGIAFAYTSDMEKIQESTSSAAFSSDTSNRYLDFSCNPKSISEQPIKEASTSVSLKNNSFPAYTYTITQNEQPLKVLDFVLNHPQKNKKIRFIIDVELFSLFRSSFNYL